MPVLAGQRAGSRSCNGAYVPVLTGCKRPPVKLSTCQDKNRGPNPRNPWGMLHYGENMNQKPKRFKRWVTYPGHKREPQSTLPADLQQRMTAHIDTVFTK
jgi:hypothetical protein